MPWLQPNGKALATSTSQPADYSIRLWSVADAIGRCAVQSVDGMSAVVLLADTDALRHRAQGRRGRGSGGGAGHADRFNDGPHGGACHT